MQSSPNQKKANFKLVISLVLCACINTVLAKPHLKKVWTTPSTLTGSESCVYDANSQAIYVSNMGQQPGDKKDGDGFIAKVSLGGKIIKQQWLTGLHAPKGIDIYNNKLYVTDIDSIVEVDIAKSSIIKRHLVGGAKFLNGLNISPQGDVYFIDSHNASINLLKNDQISSFYKNRDLNAPNGVYVMDNSIATLSWGDGHLRLFDLKGQQTQLFSTNIKQGDGIIKLRKGFLGSSATGKVYFIDDKGNAKVVLDIQPANAADICYIAEQQLLLIPTLNGNSLQAYRLNEQAITAL